MQMIEDVHRVGGRLIYSSLSDRVQAEAAE